MIDLQGMGRIVTPLLERVAQTDAFAVAHSVAMPIAEQLEGCSHWLRQLSRDINLAMEKVRIPVFLTMNKVVLLQYVQYSNFLDVRTLAIWTFSL